MTCKDHYGMMTITLDQGTDSTASEEFISRL